MSKATKWWLLTAVTGFASFISFFHINSYFADTHNANTIFTIAGVVLALASIFCMYKVSKNTNTGGSQEK